MCLRGRVCGVSQCSYTDVLQSAPLRAEACPGPGSLPREDISVLTHCVLGVLRGKIHPITLK